MRPLDTPSILDLLRRFESRNVTFIDPEGGWPVIWDRAQGNFVWDLEGKRYVDLTAAFGVAAAGHANPRVVRAGQRQMAKLLHAMGDVHPHALKALLAEELSRLTYGRWAASRSGGSGDRAKSQGRTIFCNSGFEAVEAALKTAILATGRKGIIAFQGAYHGLGYGALNATHREHFRGPFAGQLGSFGEFVLFPVQKSDLATVQRSIEKLLRSNRIGAVLVEPVQARGGINVPPPGFLPMLRRLCSDSGTLLVLDEIYTGFGRTGRWFACEHWKVVPDVICLGKALTGGFPLAACVGRSDLMDAAWPTSTGEAIHTSTFLGHPVGCAMALAQIREIGRRRLVGRASALGRLLQNDLRRLRAPPGVELQVRGLGLLVGLEVAENGKPATDRALWLIKQMLQKGFVLLPEGEMANVIAFTPPLIIRTEQLQRAVSVLKTLLELSQSQTYGASQP